MHGNGMPEIVDTLKGFRAVLQGFNLEPFKGSYVDIITIIQSNKRY